MNAPISRGLLPNKNLSGRGDSDKLVEMNAPISRGLLPRPVHLGYIPAARLK